MRGETFDVHLVSTEGESVVESPVTADSIDYYDSVVWVTREGDRLFFPYEQIRVIEQRSGEESAGESSGEE